MKTYIDEINERIKFVQSVTEKSAPLYQQIEGFGLVPPVEMALKDMLFYILDSAFSGMILSADYMALDLAAIVNVLPIPGEKKDQFTASVKELRRFFNHEVVIW